MKIYQELYSHLNKLVTTINSCNFIDYDDKKDLVQDVILTLYKKIEDKTLTTDFNDIKGYAFISLQNACRAHHKKETRRETHVSEFWEITDTSTTTEDQEYREYLHSVANSYIQQTKYSPLERKIMELLLENYTDEEIRQETGLKGKEVGKYKFRIKNKMKFDYRRPVKYVIKNMFNKNIQVPCFSLADAKNYLSHILPRRVIYMCNDNYISSDGFYIETLIKRKRKTKDE